MSRFLISTMPAAGHVHPGVPIVRSLVARGHDVLWHTGPAYAAVVERAGATFVPFVDTPDFTQVPPDPDPGTRGAAEAVSALRNLLLTRMSGQLRDYERISERYPIDAVLVDLCALGGAALHERRGLPWATLGISPLTMPGPDTPPFGTGWPPPRGPLGRSRIRLYNQLGDLMLRGLTTAYARERAALGLRPLPRGRTLFDDMLSPMLHLQAATPSIEYPRRVWPTNVELVGPLLPPAPEKVELPSWWEELAAADRVVHVTQGTVATDPDLLVRPAMEALADLDGLVVVTTPDPAALGTVPSNVRVARFVPHALLLPHVRVMVSNAGYNGVKTALAHGVPLVLAPWGNDQPDVAARAAWAGAAVNLRVRRPDPGALGAAVRTALTDERYARAAARLAAEFARYPGGELAADHLERLAQPAVSAT